MKKLFSAESLAQRNGLVFLRIVTGLLMAYHGLEIFKPELIKGYADWDKIKVLPYPLVAAYIGKGLEFVTGVLLAIGLFTRIAALLMFLNMMVICFYIATGKFWYEDQHPFIFGLLALVFFFTGPIKLSFDHVLFKPKKKYY